MQKVKILLVGNDQVGKTALSFYLCNNYGKHTYERTIGVDLCLKNININGDRVQLHIYDSSGSKRYQHISEIYVKTAEVVILVYSVTDRQSFIDIEYWIECVSKIKSLNNLVIIGNKSDQGPFREISYNDGKELADKYQASFFECSAINGTNVELAFKTAAEKVINQYISEGYLDSDNVDFTIFNDYDTDDISCWGITLEVLKKLIGL